MKALPHAAGPTGSWPGWLRCSSTQATGQKAVDLAGSDAAAKGADMGHRQGPDQITQATWDVTWLPQGSSTDMNYFRINSAKPNTRLFQIHYCIFWQIQNLTDCQFFRFAITVTSNIHMHTMAPGS